MFDIDTIIIFITCKKLFVFVPDYSYLFIQLMSNKSGSQSSNSSAAQLQKCVEQLLIESDEQEKNQRKLNSLKNEFPVLKKINTKMVNSQKLLLFLRDNNFKQKVMQKLIENGVHLQEGVPILKVYLISTRYNSQIQEELDEADIINLFQKFGHINQVYVCETFAYIAFQQIISVYVAMKTLNQFHINERARLRVRICTQDQNIQANSIFYYRSRGVMGFEPSCASTNPQIHKNIQGQLKYIVKFEFQVQNLPEFNIAQRIIGPKGSYMKKIIQKMLSKNSFAHKYNVNNIDSVFKMRIRGKGSGFLEAGQESEQKMHLFVSSKQKWMYEAACQQIQILLIKVFQDYKVCFQKLYRQHAYGIAYKILQYQVNYFTQIRVVYLQGIEQAVDLISLENQQKISQKIIEEKIILREQARKNGKYQQADQIRNWLKSKGVMLIDPKLKRGKTTWTYIKL